MTSSTPPQSPKDDIKNNSTDNAKVPETAIAKKKRLKAKLKEIKGRLRREARNELKPIIFGTFAMLCSTVSNQALPRFLAKALDQSSSSSSSKESKSNTYTSTSASLAIIVIGGGLASFLRTTLLSRAQENIASRLRKETFSKLMIERELEWFRRQQKGDGNDFEAEDDDCDEEISSPNSPTALNNILTDDIERLSETVTTTVANTFRSTCSVVFSTYHMMSLDPHLFTLSISIVPIIGGAAVVLNKFVKKVKAKQDAIMIKASAFAQDRIAKIATVKLSNRDTSEVETYDRFQREAQQMGRAVTLAKGGYMGFIFTASSGAIAAVFRAGGRSVGDGKMSHGELKSFVAYTFLLGLGTAGVMRGLGEMSRGYVCAERVYRLMGFHDNDSENKVTVAPPTTGKRIIDSNDKKIVSMSLSDATFAYNTNSSTTKTQILKKVSLKIQKGKVIALVGRNGCGKSTLASLLVGLYRPQSGGVDVHYDTSADGNATDFYSLDRKTQSSLIQLVPQNPAFFEMSIRDNITYANPNATLDKINQVLTLSNANDFISNLNGGLEYNVGRDGSNLSAGQRQRLALARALLSDPPFLILDEPNTSLDASGKIAVAEVVQACRDGEYGVERGLLLITHRVESFALADSIVVLKDGEIVEEGTYLELSENRDSELSKLIPNLL